MARKSKSKARQSSRGRAPDRRSAVRFRKLARQILKARWDFRPTTAQEFGLHQYDGKLPDFSARAFARRIAAVRSQVRQLRGIRTDSLPPKDRLDRGILDRKSVV